MLVNYVRTALALKLNELKFDKRRRHHWRRYQAGHRR